MKTALIKNSLREIKSSLGRFISIAVMLLLGTFAFVGIKSAGPDMRNTLEKFTEESNMSHMMVQFTTGIEEKDKNKILEYEEISDTEFLKGIELKTEKDDKLINLIELPKKISKPKVLEGRYPEKEGEILLDNSLKEEINIGDNLVFKKEEKTLQFILDDDKKESDNKTEDKLIIYNYTVVGFCITPEYLGEEDKGQSFSKYGEFYSFGYISRQNFTILKDVKENLKTQLAYLKFKNLDNIKISDLGFESRSIKHKKYLEKVFDNRPDELFNEMNNNILDEISVKEKEIDKVKKDFKKANNEILKNKADIITGWDEYDEGISEYNYEIEKAEKEIKNAKKNIESAKKEYEEGLKKFNKEKKEYEIGLEEYNSNIKTYEKSKKELEEAEKQINLLKQNKNQLLDLKTLVSNEKKIKRYN